MKVFVSGRLTPEWAARFGQEFELDYYDWGENPPLPPAELVRRMQGAQVFLTEDDQITRAVFEQTPDLAVIIDTRAAPVNIDLAAATEHGVVVLNTPGRNADAVADLTVALMIMAARHLWPAMAGLRQNRWVEQGMLGNYLAHQGRELPGKTVGLVGLGAVGRLVVKRLRGFELRALAYDPFVQPEAAREWGVELADLDTVLSQADFVSLHAPVTPATTGMIGAREFGLMKPTAYFVNTARAALVDEAALLAALREGRIAGAALDVFHREPLPADAPLLELPNVVAVPHLGGATAEVTAHQSRIAYEALTGLLRGAPLNVVNRQALPQALRRLGLKSD